MTNKWVYKVSPLPIMDFTSFEYKLSEISEQGWELVNIIESPSLRKLFKIETTCFAILKKPKT